MKKNAVVIEEILDIKLKSNAEITHSIKLTQMTRRNVLAEEPEVVVIFHNGLTGEPHYSGHTVHTNTYWCHVKNPLPSMWMQRMQKDFVAVHLQKDNH